MTETKSWEYSTFNIPTLIAHDWQLTTATKTVTRGEHKGHWHLMWNPAQGGLWSKF